MSAILTKQWVNARAERVAEVIKIYLSSSQMTTKQIGDFAEENWDIRWLYDTQPAYCSEVIPEICRVVKEYVLYRLVKNKLPLQVELWLADKGYLEIPKLFTFLDDVDAHNDMYGTAEKGKLELTSEIKDSTDRIITACNTIERSK